LHDVLETHLNRSVTLIKRTITTFAIITALVALPTFAAAQPPEKPQSKPVEKMTGQKPAMPPDKPGQPNFGVLISSINNMPRELSELQARTNLTASDVRIVNVADLMEGNNRAALDNALSKNTANNAKLSTAISANKVLADYLNTNKVVATRVVAIDVPPSGPVTLFVQPTAGP
jgi:hypothetical protein